MRQWSPTISRMAFTSPPSMRMAYMRQWRPAISRMVFTSPPSKRMACKQLAEFGGKVKFLTRGSPSRLCASQWAGCKDEVPCSGSCSRPVTECADHAQDQHLLNAAVFPHAACDPALQSVFFLSKPSCTLGVVLRSKREHWDWSPKRQGARCACPRSAGTPPRPTRPRVGSLRKVPTVHKCIGVA